jgi:methanogenic corrinoid protein MtbC1
MDKWDFPRLAGLGPHPAAVAAEALALLDLPESSEYAALAEDGIKTLDAALAVDQPAILADFLGYAATRLSALSGGLADPQGLAASFRRLVGTRLAPDDAAAVESFVDRALSLARWSAPTEPDREHFGPLARDYLDLVLAGRRDEARALARRALQSGGTVRTVLMEILEPAQREIGRRWQVGEISVAQEHFCTAVTQLVLTDLYPYLFTGAGRTRRLVAVDAPGSLHQVGLRMVVDLLEFEGWETSYIGSTTPEEIVDQVVKHGAAVLAISASMPSQVPAVAALIAAVRADPRARDLKVLVGGRPFSVAPDLVTTVGADDWAASAADAVDACNRLVEAIT